MRSTSNVSSATPVDAGGVGRRQVLQGGAAFAGALVLGRPGPADERRPEERPTLVVLWLNGGPAGLFNSADSFLASGAFGVRPDNVRALGNGLFVDAGSFGALPAPALAHMASINFRHGIVAAARPRARRRAAGRPAQPAPAAGGRHAARAHPLRGRQRPGPAGRRRRRPSGGRRRRPRARAGRRGRRASAGRRRARRDPRGLRRARGQHVGPRPALHVRGRRAAGPGRDRRHLRPAGVHRPDGPPVRHARRRDGRGGARGHGADHAVARRRSWSGCWRCPDATW